jgi:DNA-binding transcriptional LysR family regulator
MLNLVHVQAFLAVVDTGGFHEAARRLGISQPTVSQQLRKLEESLGVALVQRAHGSAAPTARGAAFLPFARRLIEGAERSIQAVRRPPLAVGASSNPGIYLLPPFVRRFERAEPKALAVRLRIGTNPETVARLESGEIDLAVTEWWEPKSGYEAIPWRQEPMLVIVPSDHPWRDRRSITPDEFITQPILGGEAGTGTGRLLRAALGHLVDRMTITQQLGSTEAVKRAVAAGLGISIVLASAVRDEVASGSLVPLRLEGPAIERQLYVLLPADMPPGSLARRFVALLTANPTEPVAAPH